MGGIKISQRAIWRLRLADGGKGIGNPSAGGDTGLLVAEVAACNCEQIGALIRGEDIMAERAFTPGLGQELRESVHKAERSPARPGRVESPSRQQRLRDTRNRKSALQASIARHPPDRIGAPENIDALAACLASDEIAFTTGQERIIDGGWTI